MILTMLLIKGLALLATKGVAIIALKSLLAFGVAATIKGLLVAGVIVGGVAWSSECVKILSSALTSLENGDTAQATIQLATLASRLCRLHGLTDIDQFPQALGAYLNTVGVELSHTQAIVSAVIELMPDIKNAKVMDQKYF